ncbi:MAG TPA: TonB-dependent receptor [Rhizomicrobium sp.]
MAFGSKSSSRVFAGASASMLAAVLSMSGASAQQAAAPAQQQSGPIETVTVTAQYVTQNLQNAPLAITAVTAQDLEERGINNLAQLSTSVPGLSLNKSPAPFGNGIQIYIRGIGQYDTAFASEPGVGIYIDDIYYGTMTGTVMDLLDLNRIEVLKGPQGVLGGKNDLGGAIRMISQKPSDDNSGYLQASYGSFNEIDIKGAMNLTVIPGHLFIRASATSRDQDGYIDEIDYACAHPDTAGSLPAVTTHANCKIGTQGGTSVRGGRLAARFVVNPQIEDNASVDVIRDNSELTPDVLYAADPGSFSDPSGETGNVYYNNGHGLKAVPRAKFLGTNSLGAPLASAQTVLEWNCAGANYAVYTQCNQNGGVPVEPGPGPLALYGIPWDQRFIPNNPFKETYGTYISQAGLHYNDGEMLHSWSATNVFDWDIFSNVHFKNITGYRSYRGAYSNDSDASPMSFQLTTTYPSNREFQEEGRFTGTLFDDKLEWTGGIFYYDRNNRARGPVILDADWDTGAHFLVFEQNDTYRTKNKSAYAHLIYHIFDNWEIFGGIRYTSETKSYFFDHSAEVPGYPGSGFFRSTVPNAEGQTPDDCNIFAGHICDHSIHPPLLAHVSKTARPDFRAGTDYHFTDDIMAYFQFSTGYRTGGTNSRPFAPDQLNSYGPEEIKSYEIGAKTQWWDDRLRLNVSAYTADYTNTIVPLAETDFSLGFPLPEVLYVNLGSSKDKGFEVEATAAPIDGLLLTANYSYVDYSANPVPGAVSCPQDGSAVCGAGVKGQFLDGCSPTAAAAGICPQVAAGTVRQGTQPILFPKSTLSLSAQYTFPLGDSAGQLTPRLDYNWQDTIYQDANNNKFTAIPARGLLDGRITWDAPEGGWQASIAVRNLTDKRYFLDTTNFAIFGEGTVEGQPGEPREWLFTIRKSF